MTETCDIAIVGAGPAGASAAFAAATSGFHVIALERKVQAGQPVQCAEFVPMMLGVDSGPVTAAFEQTISAMNSFVGNKFDCRNGDFRGRMIDRAAFDAELAARAETAGASVRFGVQVNAIAGDGSINLGDGRMIRPRLIVGADGPHSRIGAAIGCRNTQIVETRQVRVPLLKAMDSTDIYLSARIPGGYAWLFPKGDCANVGIGVDRRWKDRLKPELDSLLDLLVGDGVIGTDLLYHTGGAIPVGGMVGPAGSIGEIPVLLAGDAAGVTNPVSGAGIPAACHSGRMAGEAAAAFLGGDAEALDDYADELDEIFGGSLRRAVARRQQILARYADNGPSLADLRRGWIAYPAYWANDEHLSGERHDELLEA